MRDSKNNKQKVKRKQQQTRLTKHPLEPNTYCRVMTKNCQCKIMLQNIEHLQGNSQNNTRNTNTKPVRKANKHVAPHIFGQDN
jgi:hypothetical protein